MDNPQSSTTKRWLLSKFYNFFWGPIGTERLAAEEEIKRYGFGRYSVARELLGLLFLLGLASLIIWGVVRFFHLEPVPWSQAFTAVLSLGIAMIAYRQWRGARHEISIDKYYDRLEVTNKRLDAVTEDKPTPEDMYTFAELDKLEYVIVKYEYGYISPGLALRALNNFKSVCRDRPGFIEKALHWVERAAYREVTRRVVRTVCNDCP